MSGMHKQLSTDQIFLKSISCAGLKVKVLRKILRNNKKKNTMSLRLFQTLICNNLTPESSEKCFTDSP